MRERIILLVDETEASRDAVKLFKSIGVDFEVVSSVYENLYPANPGFGLGHVIDFVEANAQLLAKNEGVERRWKALRGV